MAVGARVAVSDKDVESSFRLKTILAVSISLGVCVFTCAFALVVVLCVCVTLGFGKRERKRFVSQKLELGRLEKR